MLDGADAAAVFLHNKFANVRSIASTFHFYTMEGHMWDISCMLTNETRIIGQTQNTSAVAARRARRRRFRRSQARQRFRAVAMSSQYISVVSFSPEERAAGLLFSGTPMECHVQVDRAYGNSKKNTIHRASQLQPLRLDVVGDEELDASHEGRSIGARSAAGLLTRHCKIAA